MDAQVTRRSRSRRIADILLGRLVTLALATAAAGLGIGSFIIMSSGAPLAIRPNLVTALVVSNLSVLLLLIASLAGRLTRVWVERRRGSAGSRLHVRLVLLFSAVAVLPTIVVGVFATAWFSLGIQFWFNDRIRTALDEGLQASQGYLAEHRDLIKNDALIMKGELESAGRVFFGNNPDAFSDVLSSQTFMRGLDEAVIFEPDTREVVAKAGLMADAGPGKISPGAIEAARTGEVPVLSNGTDTEVRALVMLNSTPSLMMMIERPVDPHILAHMHLTEDAVAQYQRLDANRAGLQVTFALIFALVALLVLAAAISIGLVLANQIARPVGWLMLAAERVRGGDLAVRVPEIASGDELAGLSRAFNRMTNQLSAQRAELMDAYSQIDERRRFTETVLSGVSAGVIGLDAQGRIELPNRAATELLGIDLLGVIGRDLCDQIPEIKPLLTQCMAASDRPLTGEIQTGTRSKRTLLVRIAPELRAGRTHGYVVTFDDITELQSAQRKAAWADVARRIAHEIKNPLTPIQLSAERLKRRFTKEISSDPETFSQLADTIVRHVGDIGRMVDEFSAFARMPQPMIKPEDIGRVAREALILQRNAHPEIFWQTDIPERGPVAPCDRRLLGQALTNLLMNAADAVTMRPRDSGEQGHICVGVQAVDGTVRIGVTDDGIGLPPGDRARLTEPYVTHKPKGTGLGLAIVKKIMEDHGGLVTLDDRPNTVDGVDCATRGTVATLILPKAEPGIATLAGLGVSAKDADGA
jgi:two-component system nitrogen regulation sensor histidine kinase NtrY